MKGIVFKELITMMESAVGEEMTDEILTELDLSSNGAYTSVGTYDHTEVLQIVTALSERTGLLGSDLVKSFGKHMLQVFYRVHPDYFEKTSATALLETVDSYIHVEVRKLYPDAELPKIDLVHEGDDIVIDYASKRPFADLAEGLIEGAYEHFGEAVAIAVPDRSNPCARQFRIQKVA